MGDTRIEWATKTWNPTVGCSRVDPACDNCYAMHFAHRGLHEVYKGLTTIRSRPRDTRPDHERERAELVDWLGIAREVPERLMQPLGVTPKRDGLPKHTKAWSKEWVFVDSMSDLFHERIPFEFIAAVFGVMTEAEDNVFVVLTKRIRRTLQFYEWAAKQWPQRGPTHTALQRSFFRRATGWPSGEREPELWPVRNIIVGFSAGTQATFDRDLGVLAQIPVACRAVSLEPMLERIELPFAERVPLGWVIMGGEAGPGARPCDVEGIVRAATQSTVMQIPTFVKQLGAVPMGPKGRILLRDPKGGDWNEWPAGVPRVRQTPELLTCAGMPIAKLGWHDG
jgi:protein gp37